MDDKRKRTKIKGLSNQSLNNLLETCCVTIELRYHHALQHSQETFNKLKNEQDAPPPSQDPLEDQVFAPYTTHYESDICSTTSSPPLGF